MKKKGKSSAAKTAAEKIKKLNLPPLKGVGKPKGKAMPVEKVMEQMGGKKKKASRMPSKNEVWY